MVNGINFITDESGNNKAVILDLVQFKKDGTKDTAIFEALADLQKLIDNAGTERKVPQTWEMAKEKLKNLKP